MGPGGDFLTALELLVPPPDGVQPLGERMWARFAAENGFIPPADYRALVDRYGVGGFGYDELTGPWLYLTHPFVPHTTLVEQSAYSRSVNIGFQRRYPAQHPGWPMWPAAGGFLPWAGTIDGDQVGWLTAGPPDSWGIGFYGRGADYYRFPFGCVEFVYRWFTGTAGVEHGDALPGDPLRFFPSPPPSQATPRKPAMEVAVELTGLGAGTDAVPRPSPSAVFEPGLTMDERRRRSEEYRRTLDANAAAAVAVVERWTAVAAQRGVRASSGRIARDASDPVHWELSLSFDPGDEELAKGLLVGLTAELGVAVRECRNIEYDLVWADVVRRSAGGR